MSKKELIEYIDNIEFGESVLVEYSSTDPIHLIFEGIAEFVRYKKLPLLIIDILDSFHVIIENLKIIGADTEKLEELPVIKGGGSIEVGKIIKKVDISTDPVVYINKFIQAVNEMYSKIPKIVVLILGGDKLSKLHGYDINVFELYIGRIAKNFLGNKARVGVYFANVDILPKEILSEWEEASTRVLAIRLCDNRLMIKVKKSPKIEDHEREFIIPIEDLSLLPKA